MFGPIDGEATTETLTTNLPATNMLLNTYCWISMGGVSSTIGMAIASMYVVTTV